MKNVLFTLLMLAFTASHAQQDLALLDIYPVDYVSTGETKKFYAYAQSLGPDYIASASVSLHWQLNGGSVQTNKPQNSTASIYQAPGGSELQSPAFTFDAPLAEGQYILKVWTTLDNTDTNTSNDTLIKVVKVIDNLPKKNVLMEVFKHQNCGPCYSADTFVKNRIDPLAHYNNVNIYTSTRDVIFSLDGDSLENALGATIHPAVVFDHFLYPFENSFVHGFYTFGAQRTKHLRNLNRREEFTEPVEVNFETVDVDTNSRTIAMKVMARFFDTLSSDLRFNIYVLEDSVRGFQALAPDPYNYYHSKVLRKILGSVWGKRSSIPDTVYPGQETTYNFDYKVPAEYSMKNLRLIALVQEYNANKAQRRIYNSTKYLLKDHWTTSVSIDAVSLDSQIRIYPNPSSDYLNITTRSLTSIEVDRFEVVDVQGQIVLEGLYEPRIDISTLPNAPYHLLLYVKGEKCVKSFVKY